MEKSSKRGKIPQSDWPLIMARYEAGETLASIARTYDCSPPAISYVVSRSRARQPGPQIAAKPPDGPEPQLIKASVPDGAAAATVKFPMPIVSAAQAAPNGHDRPAAAIVPSNHHRENYPTRESHDLAGNGTGERRVDASADGPRPRLAASDDPQVPALAPQSTTGGNGNQNPAATTSGDQRRTLHLSLGTPTHHNGGPLPAEILNEPERPVVPEHSPHLPQSAAAAAPNGQDGAPSGLAGVARAGYSEHLRRNDAEIAPRKDASSFIDHELRARVDGDIAAFLAAFDAALVGDTQENRSALREATDRLLRAGARTRIELERLEARLPLPPRDNVRSGEAAWRHR